MADQTNAHQGEVRMPIDGDLVEAASGKRFENVNPATEEVLGYAADLPFGGYKSSGIGRQNGLEGFEQHLETKAVALPA